MNETIVTGHAEIRVLRSLWFTLPAALTVLAGCAPQAGLQQMRLDNASLDIAAYRAHAPTIQGPLTLHEALAYASQYNIELWIAAQETKFQHELATQSILKMLPSLVIGSAYSERSHLDASSSLSFETRKESLEPSFSSDRQTRTFDVSATWNLLDFGISFLRARQQDNRVTIALQRERRARQNLALGVTRAYWRAVTARESAERAERIRVEVTATLERIGEEMFDKTISQIDGLKRETSLLDRLDELRRYNRDFQKAKTELVKLIGLPPGTPLSLAEVDFSEPIDAPAYDVDALDLEALRSRPELFEKDLEETISRDEARAALARMFPSLALFFQLNHDENRFLVFDNWNTAGLRASWDLLSIPQQIKQRDAINAQTELIAGRRTAIAVAILTQLRLSLLDHEDALERYQFSKMVSQKSTRLFEAIRVQMDEGKSHSGELIDQRIKALKARAKHLAAYAAVMTSIARVDSTIGRDPARAGHTPGDSDVAVETGEPPGGRSSPGRHDKGPAVSGEGQDVEHRGFERSGRLP